MIAASAALLVWAAGFALFSWLAEPYGPALAAAAVAGACIVFLGAILILTNQGKDKDDDKEKSPLSPAHSLIQSFGETIKDRPLLTMGLTVLTGVAATRDPNLLKDLWNAVLQPKNDRD